MLGFQPTSYGFGWAAFSSPLSLYDWGLHHAKRRKNATCLRRLEKLLSRLSPETIVLETYEGCAARSVRVVDLCTAVVALAMDQRIDVAIYTRNQIKSCFGTVGARSRQEVAEAVARSFEALRPRLPKPRKAWDPPDRRMAIFDAAAAVMAHYQTDAARVIERILDAKE
ncbi:MAG TPA: hypothetical protein VGW40_10460 [Allosphingosinicella sp.]|nr:hypothetical protein [Allosphingosinicella sp.]